MRLLHAIQIIHGVRIALLEPIGDEDRVAVERLNLAELEFATGDVRRALDLVEEAIAELSRGFARDERS